MILYNMKKNRNKIEEMEKKILDNSKTKDKLAIIMDPLLLWIEEMKNSFSSIFVNKSSNDYMITLEIEKFENNLRK